MGDVSYGKLKFAEYNNIEIQRIYLGCILCANGNSALLVIVIQFILC